MSMLTYIDTTDIPEDIRSILEDDRRAEALLMSLRDTRDKASAQGLFGTVTNINKTLKICLKYIRNYYHI